MKRTIITASLLLLGASYAAADPVAQHFRAAPFVPVPAPRAPTLHFPAPYAPSPYAPAPYVRQQLYNQNRLLEEQNAILGEIRDQQREMQFERNLQIIRDDTARRLKEQ